MPNRFRTYFNPRSPDGERPGSMRCGPRPCYFNPRSPDGERPTRCKAYGAGSTISIHAPRMGSDAAPKKRNGSSRIFQSTLPGWGATIWRSMSRASVSISIHAPRMGSDLAMYGGGTTTPEFQSTLPGWGATRLADIDKAYDVFQSTLPGWGATQARGGGAAGGTISIHAPRMGSDHERQHRQVRADHISIHAPRMGSDRYFGGTPWEWREFQSTLPGWGATRRPDGGRPTSEYFNPRSPDGERHRHLSN